MFCRSWCCRTQRCFPGSRLDRVAEAFAGRPIHIQVSLDPADADINDAGRGDDNFDDVTKTIPVLLERGLKVRTATTSTGLTAEAHGRLCELHRSWGIPDEDHIVRPIVARGRAGLIDMGGIEAEREDLPAELCLTADGAFWESVGAYGSKRPLSTPICWSLGKPRRCRSRPKRWCASPRHAQGERCPIGHPLSVNSQGPVGPDIILPALNEAAALLIVQGNLPPGYRAIVVDNGSTDGTATSPGPSACSLSTCRSAGSVPPAGLASRPRPWTSSASWTRTPALTPENSRRW